MILTGLSCQHGGDNHSDDRISVFHGTVEPRVLCGYHAMTEGWTA